MYLNNITTNCRTCLRRDGEMLQLSDYAEGDEDHTISEMLDGIVPQIQIKVESQFSQLICQACLAKLLTGYKFQQLCIDSNQKLHAWLPEVVTSKEEQQDGDLHLENILDPLTGGDCFKMKEESEEHENFECEINPEEVELNIKSDGEWEGASLDGERDYAERVASDSDSSNEMLSVLKERKLKKSSKMQASDKSPRKSRRNSASTVFPCTECGKVFDRLYRLKRHSTVHSKKRAFPCEICKYSFAAEKTYLAHMQIHEIDGTDGTNNREFQCSDCPKSFEKKAALVQHSQIHNKKKAKSKIRKLSKDKEDDLEKKETKCEGENEFIKDQIEDCPQVQPNEEKENAHQIISDDIVKHEFEITPNIFEEPLDVYDDDNGEWYDDDYEDSENEDESLGKDRTHKTRNVQNTDFVDTGIGEIEKPNTRNRRNGTFPCEVCKKIFDRPYRLKRHTSVHSLERPYVCEVCKYRFATPNLLKIHMIQHENEAGSNFSSRPRPDGFKCPDCPRRFEKQASLSAHRQIHTRNASETNYPCTVCQRNFMSIRSLTEHITNKHPEAEKHKCNQCDKTFVLHAHLVEHLNRHKGNKNFVCLICEKEFGYTNTLKEHMRTHSGESPYLCPQCGKTFRSASNLRQHMERHFGLKKYQCPECPSRFNCRSDLCKHTSTHTKAKPHVCDVCGSRFTRSYSLQKHKLLHSGERPYKCDQCSMTFVIVYHLRRHMRTHTGEKPYKCKFCDRAYAESGDLTKHLRTHVGENTYMCTECPMAFKYQTELREHLSEHYKMSQQLKKNDETQQAEEPQQQQLLQQHELLDPQTQQHELLETQEHMLQHQQPHIQEVHENDSPTLSHVAIINSNQPPVILDIPISNINNPPPPNTSLNLVDGC
uniref:Protein krueppel n=1 Tax=Stomoxys calcitrans TaxID=35570 RepID=A0A1I8PSQ1_STOCA